MERIPYIDKCLSNDEFERVCCKDEHYIFTMCRLFDICGENCFQAPWHGVWLTSSQAYRLMLRIYKVLPNIMTVITTAILQFVLDVWNIPRVFGENSVYAFLSGCTRYTTPTPPWRRLSADDFARLLHL